MITHPDFSWNHQICIKHASWDNVGWYWKWGLLTLTYKVIWPFWLRILRNSTLVCWSRPTKVCNKSKVFCIYRPKLRAIHIKEFVNIFKWSLGVSLYFLPGVFPGKGSLHRLHWIVFSWSGYRTMGEDPLRPLTMLTPFRQWTCVNRKHQLHNCLTQKNWCR